MLQERVGYEDILGQIEELSRPLPQDNERLARLFVRIPRLAHRLRWCEIPTATCPSVIERLSQLAQEYGSVESAMAGHIARDLKHTVASIQLTLSHNGLPSR